jgi:hypothetical protein
MVVMSMGGADSMASRYGAPLPRPVPFLFLRDRQTEKRDGLAVAGKLLCPWPAPFSDDHLAELAEIKARLAAARGCGLGLVGSWVTKDSVRPFKIQSAAWLARMAADGVVVPIRVARAA